MLPSVLINRYRAWKSEGFTKRARRYSELAEKGQTPHAMIISCCDSRVQATEIFGTEAGEFFIHRNVANLVPPYAPNSDFHGTSSAIEYAVKVLRVPHIIVLGHSQCGGVQACYDMCSESVSATDSDFEFIGHWLDMLRPAFDCLSSVDEADRIVEMGQRGALGSLNNLEQFPFVAEAVAAGTLQLHAAWHDIGSGTLYVYNPDTDRFEAQ